MRRPVVTEESPEPVVKDFNGPPEIIGDVLFWLVQVAAVVAMFVILMDGCRGG